jgi:hypothetical protein
MVFIPTACLVHFPFRKPRKNRVISISDGGREKYVLNISNKSKPSKLPGDTRWRAVQSRQAMPTKTQFIVKSAKPN